MQVSRYSMAAEPIDRAALRIEHIKGKGIGILAAKHLTRGQKLISEKALLHLPAKLQLSSPSLEAAQKYFEDEISNIPVEDQDAFYSLSDWRSEQAGIPKNAYHIFLSNALPRGRGKHAAGAGVYATACRINHSCQPNCHFSWCSGEQREVVYAVANVQPDQELAATYAEPFTSRNERRAFLNRKFGFTCACSACSAEGNQLKESDEIRARLSALDTEIQCQKSDEKAYQGLDEFQRLMRDEGIENPYFLARLCQAVLENQQFPVDSPCMQHFAKLGWESFTVCEGRYGDRTVDLEQYLPEIVT